MIGLFVSVVIIGVFVVRFEVVVEFVLVEDKIAAVKVVELDIGLLMLIRYCELAFLKIMVRGRVVEIKTRKVTRKYSLEPKRTLICQSRR